MRAEVKWYDPNIWQEIKNNALFTIHKESKTPPTDEWKLKMLYSEHSPIRSGRLIINVYDVPSFVITHFIRHHIGIEKYVATFRNDRIEYVEVPNRNTLQNMRLDIDFQAFINISRKRYCYQASKETREVWQLIMDAVKAFEPQLYQVCVKECVYRNGLCPEYKTCGYNKTEAFKQELEEYIKPIKEQVSYNNIIDKIINIVDDEHNNSYSEIVWYACGNIIDKIEDLK